MHKLLGNSFASSSPRLYCRGWNETSSIGTRTCVPVPFHLTFLANSCSSLQPAVSPLGSSQRRNGFSPEPRLHQYPLSPLVSHCQSPARFHHMGLASKPLLRIDAWLSLQPFSETTR